jgi:transaldolase
VDEDGRGGVSSNPAIFEKAITGSADYADALAELQKRKDLDAWASMRSSRSAIAKALS